MRARISTAPLAERFPHAALTQYELGLSQAALSETDAAIASLQRATRAKPDLADPWKALGDLLFAVGDEQGAAAAFAAHERALIQSPDLQIAGDRLLTGDLREAEQLLRAHLARRQNDLEALALLARAVARQARDAEAEAVHPHIPSPLGQSAHNLRADTRRGAFSVGRSISRRPATDHGAHRKKAGLQRERELQGGLSPVDGFVTAAFRCTEHVGVKLAIARTAVMRGR